jgi:hypothetical protein
MTTQASYKDEWLDKAFQLAFFLHGDRETAKTIAASAMSKLETASNAQFKRYYYTPTGRAENARASRSRVSLNDLQLLQRLVFVESENFEREKEKSAKACKKSLLKYFVKHLVRISLKRNSFYVTLAVSRILHNYGTADAMEIYNIVVQDPERVHDDYYYRSRKGILMKEMKARFGDLLEIVRANRGEERFQADSQNEDLTETAKSSLKFFTPWNSDCAIPEKFDPFEDVIKPFHFDKRAPDEEHRIEVNRIHAALHPSCFGRLATALRLPPPEKKLEIPKFMYTENRADPSDNGWGNPSHLEADELKQIKDILTAQAESRKALTAGFLRVVADGAERARINLDETDAASFDLDGDAELIEIYATGKGQEVLLATHLLSFDDLKNGNHAQTVVLEGGQKISFNLVPSLDQYGEVSDVKCTVNYAETAWQKRLALALRRSNFTFANYFGQSSRILKPALTLGLVLLALTFGWFVLREFGNGEKPIAIIPENSNQNSETKLPDNSPPKENKPKEENFAGEKAPNNLQEPNPLVPRRNEKTETAQNQKLAVEKKPGVLMRKETVVNSPQNELRAVNQTPRRENSGVDENGVLRLPVIESNPIPDRSAESRGNSNNRRNTNSRGKSLREVRLIYIELSGEQILGKKIAEQISAEIQKSGAFVITGDKEQADAALKIYVRHESDGDAPSDATVAAIVRLVNAEGFVVYPNRRRVSGWKYVGTILKLPARVAQDLEKAKQAK